MGRGRVGVEEGRQFRFRGDLYFQESTFPLVIHVYTILDVWRLIIHLIHYKMYISILSWNLDVEIYKFILRIQIYIILQNIKVNMEILSYYYNCTCM